MSEDERAIREAISTWLRASESGDTTTLLGLMTDDVVFLGAGRAPFGKKEFAAAQEKQKDEKLETSSTILEIRVAGDWAYVITDLKVAMTPAGGDTVRRSGNTLSIFQRTPAGKWVIARDANMLAAQPD